VVEQLKNLNDEEAKVKILKAETGDITGKDIELAKSARAIIVAFQVGINEKTETIAKRERVPFRLYKIIYELVDEVDAALASLLDPELEEVEIARAKIKQVFVLSNKSKVAGCEVTKGTVLKGYSVYVERKEEEIGRGKITSLKQNKEEVKEIKKGQDCGILIEPEVDIEEGDEIVCYKIEKY
jgi:translation initiation factor IF-2